MVISSITDPIIKHLRLGIFSVRLSALALIAVKLLSGWPSVSTRENTGVLAWALQKSVRWSSSLVNKVLDCTPGSKVGAFVITGISFGERCSHKSKLREKVTSSLFTKGRSSTQTLSLTVRIGLRVA